MWFNFSDRNADFKYLRNKEIKDISGFKNATAI